MLCESPRKTIKGARFHFLCSLTVLAASSRSTVKNSISIGRVLTVLARQRSTMKRWVHWCIIGLLMIGMAQLVNSLVPSNLFGLRLLLSALGGGIIGWFYFAPLAAGNIGK